MAVTLLSSLTCDGRDATLAAATAPLAAAGAGPFSAVMARDARKSTRALEAQVWWEPASG